MLEHLPLADAIASVMARRLFPLVEREDLIQVARGMGPCGSPVEWAPNSSRTVGRTYPEL